MHEYIYVESVPTAVLASASAVVNDDGSVTLSNGKVFTAAEWTSVKMASITGGSVGLDSNGELVVTSEPTMTLVPATV